MFQNRVMGQNVKRLLSVALFLSKSDPNQNMPSNKSYCSSDSRDSRNDGFYKISHSVVQLIGSNVKSHFFVNLDLLTSVSSHNFITSYRTIISYPFSVTSLVKYKENNKK